jgi:hypothetical protein
MNVLLLFSAICFLIYLNTAKFAHSAAMTHASGTLRVSQLTVEPPRPHSSASDAGCVKEEQRVQSGTRRSVDVLARQQS